MKIKIIEGLTGPNGIPASSIDGYEVTIDGSTAVIPHEWLIQEQQRQQEESEKRLRKQRAEEALERSARIRKIASKGIPDNIPLDLLFP